ncbi:hypothetical protein [Legionella oakridgensis]|uniref:hypothetical protein n=1 Tax=Legionella oakridgensis TaxID=29423 RepID=UPI0003DDFF09|nr:hypothetical protein [Legionella oakridgensis]ETO93529.1 hypothetical protein LOR_69c19660 [Legionella oakridgensis RV-2-2007]
MPTVLELVRHKVEAQKSNIEAWANPKKIELQEALSAVRETQRQLVEALKTKLGVSEDNLKELVKLANMQTKDEELTILVSTAEEKLAEAKLISSKNRLVLSIQEFYNYRNSTIEKIAQFREELRMFEEQRNLKQLPKEHRPLIAEYIKNLDTFLESYLTLDLDAPIANAGAPTEEVLIALNAIVQSEQFLTYMKNQHVLALGPETIQFIFQGDRASKVAQSFNTELQKKTGDAFIVQTYIAAAIQNELKYKLFFKSLAEFLEQIEEINTASSASRPGTPRSDASDSSTASSESVAEAQRRLGEIASEFNFEKAIQDIAITLEKQLREAGSSTQEQQKFILRKMLELNLNTPLHTESEDISRPEGKYFSTYLKMVLTRAYPDIFYLDASEKLGVKMDPRDPSGSKYKTICKAFGLDLSNTSYLPGAAARVTELQLDPAQFNAGALEELHQQDGKRNLLWLVLKSTMPVSETFTAEQKIQTYQALADAAVAGQLGGTDKYIAALNLQKAAFKIAQEHDVLPTFTAAFGPESELGKYINAKIEEHHSELRSVSIADIQAAEISKIEAAVSAQKESIQEKLGEVTPTLQTEPEETQHLHEELSKELRTTLTSAKESMDVLKTAASILQTSLSTPDADRAALTREHARISRELATIYDHGRVQSQLRSVEQRADAKREEVARLETLLSQLKERCAIEEGKLTTVGSTNDTLTGALSEQKAAIGVLQEKLIAVNAELDGLQITHQALSQEATALASEKKSLNSTLATLDTVLTLQAEKRELAGQLAETTSTLRSEREALSRANDELIHIRSSLDTASQESTRLRRQIEELTASHAAKLKEIGLENTEARRQLVEEHSSQLQQLQTRLQRSEEHGSSLAEQLNTKSRTLEERETELSRLRDTLVKQERAQQQLQERFEALTSTHDELGVQLHTQEEATAEARRQFEEANATLVLLQETHRELTLRSERLASENGALREQIAPLQARVQDLELQLAARDEELRAARETASRAQEESRGLKIEISELRAQLDELRRQQELSPPLIRDTVSSARAAIRTMRDGSEEVHAAPAKISFAEFCEQFKARFPKTNSDGIKDMIKFMEQIKNQDSTDADKFAATAKRMHDIAADRADSAWLQNKKLGLFGSGRSPEVQKLYNAMKQDDFSLNLETTKNFLLGREPAAPSSERAFKS